LPPHWSPSFFPFSGSSCGSPGLPVCLPWSSCNDLEKHQSNYGLITGCLPSYRPRKPLLFLISSVGHHPIIASLFHEVVLLTPARSCLALYLTLSCISPPTLWEAWSTGKLWLVPQYIAWQWQSGLELEPMYTAIFLRASSKQRSRVAKEKLPSCPLPGAPCPCSGPVHPLTRHVGSWYPLYLTADCWSRSCSGDV
jgi:hypothetical protein